MDIKSLLSDLHGLGLSDSEVARRTGVQQTLVSRARSGRGKDMTYRNGKAIERLHEALTRRGRRGA